MRLLFILSFILPTLTTFGQNFEYQSPCIEDEGKLEESYSPPAYSVKKFPKKTKINFVISKFIYEGKEYSVDFHYEGKIKYETDVLTISDSLGLGMKINIAQTSINGKNKYLYQIAIYKKYSKCWRAVTSFSNYFLVYAQIMEMTGGGYASPGTKNYFEYVKGSLTFNNVR